MVRFAAVLQAADRGLEDRDPLARLPRRPCDDGRDDGLADLGPGAGDEDAAQITAKRPRRSCACSGPASARLPVAAIPSSSAARAIT